MKKKQQKKSRLPAGAAEAIVVFAVALAVVLGIVLIRHRAPEQQNAEPQLSTDLSLPIALGSGTSLTGLYTTDALFPEDGSNEMVENLLCAVVRNDSEQTLEYMEFQLLCGGETYDFSVSTLPPNCEVYAFEKNRAQVTDPITELEPAVPIELFFREEPERMEDTLQITVQNGSIDVKNITDAPIDHEIQVYYKNTENLSYFGGITYFFRVLQGLQPGEVYNGYASNASKDRTEVMFVKYGN